MIISHQENAKVQCNTLTKMAKMGMRISSVGEEWSHQDSHSLLVGKSAGTMWVGTLVVSTRVTFHLSYDPGTDSTLTYVGLFACRDIRESSQQCSSQQPPIGN